MSPVPSIPPPLPRRFYRRSAVDVARDCIGKHVVSRIEGELTIGRIVETEAYCGPGDAAAHSFRGRRTARTEVMFGPPGYAYVFRLYGVHHAFNLVTAEDGVPEAVLVRAIEPVWGLPLMAMRRGRVLTDDPNVSNGPGKLCQALGISMEHYGADLMRGAIRVADGPPMVVKPSPRVGIDYAGRWAHKPWRFFAPGNRYVSGPR